MKHYTSLRTAQVCALAAFYIMYLYKRHEMYAIFKMYSSRNVERNIYPKVHRSFLVSRENDIVL